MARRQLNLWVGHRCFPQFIYWVGILFVFTIHSFSQDRGISLREAPSKQTVYETTLTVFEDRHFEIENSIYRIILDSRLGQIRSLYAKTVQQEILQRPVPLFAIRVGGMRVMSDQIEWRSYETSQDQLRLHYAIHGDTGELIAQVTIRPSTGRECVFSLRIHNPALRPQSIRLLFPALSGVQFDGIALSLPEWRGMDGNLLHEKGDPGWRMGVSYGDENPLRIPPHGEFATPNTILRFQTGDAPNPHPFGSG